MPSRSLRPLSTRHDTFARAFRGAATVVTATALAIAAAGCGGGGRDDSARMADAISSLYVIDHAGSNPDRDALEPYEQAFDKLRADCDDTIEELTSSILAVASDASNGSGTTITNLEAMHAVGDYLRR